MAVEELPIKSKADPEDDLDLKTTFPVNTRMESPCENDPMVKMRCHE